MYVGRLLFGSANIVRARQQRLRIALVWMTALLLTLPRAALPCGCHVVQLSDSKPAAGVETHHCQHGCCHASQITRPKFRVVCAVVRSLPMERTLSSQPCGCPEHCPCRLHHAPQHVGLVRSASLTDDHDVASASFVLVIPPLKLQTADCSCNSPQQTTCSTAQERCSLLCRFTI